MRKGVVYSDSGIPCPPRWFADGRTAVQLDESGISQVDYMNPLGGQRTIFLRRLWDGIRYYLERDGVTYRPEYIKSETWPFGIEARWPFDGITYRHRVMVVDEAIVIQLQTPSEVGSDIRFKMEFYEGFQLVTADKYDLRFFNRGVSRTWGPWEFSRELNQLSGGFTGMKEASPSAGHYDEQNQLRLGVCISADFLLEHTCRPLRSNNTKHILKSPALQSNTAYSIVIRFSPDVQALSTETRVFIDGLDKRVERQFERYIRVAESSPVLSSPYQLLNDFISLVPMYHESLKIKDVPGAIRAKTTNYGVWGWDGMTSNNACMYFGDAEHVRDMLRFYEETADPDRGIAHAFRNDLTPMEPSALPAQGMYITLLCLYYAGTGDRTEVERHFEFAKKIFLRTLEKGVGSTGLCEGTSLFPDFRALMNETGHDLSAFNNTVFYCAARSMEYLAGVIGDESTQQLAQRTCEKIESHFIPLFYNPQRKFVVSSVDSQTLEQRDRFHISGIKWENDYCHDLVSPIDDACMSYFETSSVCAAGLREVPVWNDAWDADSNQLHCWWPVTGEYFMRLINSHDRSDLITKWVGWVSYWTKQLMCPEGISCYLETDQPECDRWTTLPGAWHGYSMRGWYQAAIHGVFGVCGDTGGLTFYPYSGEEMSLRNFHFHNHTFDIELIGSGPHIDWIDVGGTLVRGTHKVPKDLCHGSGTTSIRVKRTANPVHPVSIRSASGLELADYSNSAGEIQAQISGSGRCWLRLWAESKPQVEIDGDKVDGQYNEQNHECVVILELGLNGSRRIRIKG